MHQLTGGRYRQMTPNERGHFLIEPLGVKLGVWYGQAENVAGDWLRWWDARGNLLPTPGERARRMQERLRALGVEPANGDAGQAAGEGK